MEEKRLSNTIHGAVFNKNILKIQLLLIRKQIILM